MKILKFTVFYHNKDTCNLNFEFPKKYIENFTIYGKGVKYFFINYKIYDRGISKIMKFM